MKRPPATKADTAARTDLLTELQAADYISMSAAWLRLGRKTGQLAGRTPPPPYFRIGESIRYSRADLDLWLTQCRIDPRRALQPQAAA